MKKPLVVYHDACTDGFGAAFAAWLKLGEEAQYLPVSYGNDCYIEMLGYAENGIIGREVYVLDFSFPKEDMKHLFANANRVVWLDHHVSSREIAVVLCEYDSLEMKDYARLEHEELNWRIVHDNNKSGALLAWEFFHPGTEVPMLIQHIDVQTLMGWLK